MKQQLSEKQPYGAKTFGLGSVVSRFRTKKYLRPRCPERTYTIVAAWAEEKYHGLRDDKSQTG